MSFGLLLCWGGFLVIGIVLLIAWARVSWKIALLAVLLSAMFGIVFTPWTVFEPTDDPDILEDTDFPFWDKMFRTIAWFWYFVT